MSKRETGALCSGFCTPGGEEVGGRSRREGGIQAWQNEH